MPDASKLLLRGKQPFTNSAGSKGGRDVSQPQRTDELKKQTIEIIQPESEQFLEILQQPKNIWRWDLIAKQSAQYASINLVSTK